MASFGEAAGAAVRAGVCALVAEDPNVVALLRRTGLAGNPLAQAARAFRLAYCSNNNPVGNPATFTGGQCLVRYLVQGFYTTKNSMGQVSNPVQFGQRLLGPIGAPFYTYAADNNKWTAFIPTGSGPSVFLVRTAQSDGSNPINVVIQTTTREDGQPDDCGNADGTVPPGTPGPIGRPIDITFENNSGNTTTLNGSLNIFAPVITPTFSPTIPIQLDLGGLTLNGNFNLDGTLDLGFDFNTGPGADRPTPEPPAGDPPDADTVIIGARVSVESDTGQTTTVLFNGDRPDLYIPRAGTIQFFQPAGDSFAWSGDVPIKTSPQWVPCGAPGYATRIAFTATPGVTLSVTAVLGRPPKE